MNEWLHNLPLMWMAVVMFTIVYLAAGAILAIIMLLARGERAHVFKRVSPGLLSPLGTVFGLLVVSHSVFITASTVMKRKSTQFSICGGIQIGFAKN